MPGKKIKKTCTCGVEYEARVADLKRGWGKSCSKSCAARRTNKKTGNFKRFLQKREATERYEIEGPTFDNAHHFDNSEK